MKEKACMKLLFAVPVFLKIPPTTNEGGFHLFSFFNMIIFDFKVQLIRYYLSDESV